MVTVWPVGRVLPVCVLAMALAMPGEAVFAASGTGRAAGAVLKKTGGKADRLAAAGKGEGETGGWPAGGRCGKGDGAGACGVGGRGGAGVGGGVRRCAGEDGAGFALCDGARGACR